MTSDDNDSHGIEVHLDRMLSERGMTLAELASRVGVTNVNLSILKNSRARAIRFTTLTRICEVLDCQPGDLLTYRGAEDERRR
ncbi:helix-turn-helix transcriptional regulator [Streptomyces sp. NBC_01387]|uniref:helix-turn-helix domain-containing protein n=1 Tax=unclassified Streptomyces TaxID=2593676 RepID=UPI002024CC68|nr:MULTISPECIES: helix-turn-helix transcriptional regulator [unclassified Streptomyces]WSV58278.1 helix-turn-helix transcriptional regulator [Streptomyces sp. NBC_01014]MCX4553075.1 helix-turn-helix transcriptional regulator [Streptomyces sp. NBC_01500]WSC24390.1 helix-turn-helix transcriptional regulator [Streptomyces sp. NBC_01766]WSC25005.1 helix-turn-helix transcriptional regulator [Streptomyces sp. NBC_01766]WSV58393.1 helix-turn-helix transcriptional regulator [Streptomyces sp. NBC_01014